MPLNLPDYDTITKRIRADVRAILDELDPTIFSSFIRAITDSNAGRHYDNVLSIQQLQKELFPTAEASRAALEIWAEYEGITPFPETQAEGIAVFVGTNGATVDEDQEFRSASGNLYTADSSATVTEKVTNITSLTRSGSTVTAVCGSEHNLASGLSPTIAGANESEYNGTFQITVIDSVTFIYEISGTPSTPATGTITVTISSALVTIISSGFGAVQNLDSGASLTATSEITDVESEGFVGANGIIGGEDEETSASLLSRTLQSRQNPVANFNEAAIIKAALSIPGVTRVKVKRITPGIGQVTILFVRDDDDNIIPSAGEVAEVEAAVLEILPAQSDPDDVFVSAPTPVETDYSFSAIDPATSTMQTAIAANIRAFYRDEVDFETNITEDKYRNAIIDTIDPETGDKLSSFTLASPTADITVGANSIGIPGEILF